MSCNPLTPCSHLWNHSPRYMDLVSVPFKSRDATGASLETIGGTNAMLRKAKHVKSPSHCMSTSATRALPSLMRMPIFLWLFAMCLMFCQAASSTDNGVGCIVGRCTSQRWRRKHLGAIMGISASRHLLKDTDRLTVHVDLRIRMDTESWSFT